MMDQSRNAAAALFEALGSGPAIKIQQGKVLAVNAGPPKSLDVLIEGRWDVPNIPYLDSIATPAVNNAVYIINYGSGRRLVFGRGA